MPANARNTRPTMSSRWLSASSCCAAHQGADQVVARVGRPVGDDGLDVAGQPLERRLDPRQVLAQVDAERLAEVVGPVRDLRPTPPPAARAAGTARGRRTARRTRSRTPPAPAARTRRSARRRAAWNCGRIASIARLRKAGLSSSPLPQVVLALQAEQGLAPPLDERPVVDAVLGRPPGVALLEAAVLEHRRALLVAQDRPSRTACGRTSPARAPRCTAAEVTSNAGSARSRNAGSVTRGCYGASQIRQRALHAQHPQDR